MTKITIGINGAVMRGAKNGIHRYTAKLLSNIEEIDPETFEFTTFMGAEVTYNNTIPTTKMSSLGTIERIWWDTVGFVRNAKSTDVDVIHSPDKGPFYRGGLPMVVTIHDLLPFVFPSDRSLYSRLYWQLSLRRQIRLSDAIITVSKSTKRDIVDMFDVDPGRIHVTYLGTDLSPPATSEVAQVETKYSLQNSPFVVLYVGNYDERKNVDQLVKSCKTLDQTGVGLQLVLAGSNPPKQQLSKLAGDFREHISFLGYVPDTELESLYGAADLFVYPSAYEGFGLPVLEAMACGTPAITSDRSSLPEVIGEAGLTVDPDDTTELAAAIERVYSNERLRADMQSDGLERANEMSWKSTARSTIDVYKSVFDHK